MNTETDAIEVKLQEKLDKLKDSLRSLGSVAIAFSGGVDSTFLLAVAHEVLGENVIAITGSVAYVPEREIREAVSFCEERDIRQIICRLDPLTDDRIRHNPPDRCYHCKRKIFGEIIKTAGENGMSYVAEGSNMDDTGDYRPGMKAVKELGVKSPLQEAGLYKEEIRLLSKAMHLPTWSKPAYACLASRLVYGEEITKEKLSMIERAEQFLIDRGYLEERVRMHGNMARIEVPARDIASLASDGLREEIYQEFRKIGFLYVALDMRGYQMGSMNQALEKR